MKKTFLILLCCLLFSCEDKKTEIVQSEVMPDVFFLKNITDNDSLTKNHIKDFLLMNHKQNDYKVFYKYSSNTKPFIDKERTGGYFREYLDDYPEDKVAIFSVSKCKNDTMQSVGQLYFFNQYGAPYKPDTLIYKCN